AGDDDGVECSYCHSLTNPDNSEHLGEQFAPYVANDGGSPAVGYYGSGMGVLWGGNQKLGPYSDAVPKHQFLASQFHRSVDFCGTCHDVSNSVVGDLAHNHGTQDTADPVVASGVPGAPVTNKAAFNNLPAQYGIVERTFSEAKSGRLIETRVGDYPTLPADLQHGAIEEAYQRSIAAGTGGDYADGAPRYFSCQTCHMGPTEGVGCNKPGVPVRLDLPRHDLTGGNYWMPAVVQYLDAQGKLRLGGGLSADEISGLNDGALRAQHQLSAAAHLEVTDLTLRVTNLTGHKLISGYPEGRRMWLNIRWFGEGDVLLREDGAYGPLVDGVGVPVEVVNPATGLPVQVQSILDLDDPNTRIYEAHYAMTQEWANQLVGLGYPTSLPLGFDRNTGAVEATLGDLAAQAPGTYHETFHFALNNKVVSDNRIPTYGMRYDVARQRNALPVPADQYGNPGPGGEYQHWDEFALTPPAGAVSATVSLLYQPTSWEYIQFLALANDKSNAFLANEGDFMLEAWIETGMAAPYTMATETIEVPEPGAALLLAAGAALLATLARRRGRAER
ncbi:MAG: PEP-CTERM sorting domain-containing protein, partial [Myxococcales bacterium]|nr:PEP-CTERM sorting domain-containing protein [Myxococcales bacterium]